MVVGNGAVGIEVVAREEEDDGEHKTHTNDSTTPR